MSCHTTPGWQLRPITVGNDPLTAAAGHCISRFWGKCYLVLLLHKVIPQFDDDTTMK